MCGIAGAISNKIYPSEKLLAQVNNFIQQQSYRGPDYAECSFITTVNVNAVFGHNRLQIIDLNANANQPMWDEQKRFCLVYNGMLYNYLELRSELQQAGFTFFSTSDTEVVLKAFMHWGTKAFNYFNGMFAIAIFDSQQEQLYLVKDRFGKKPLFYIQIDQRFYFASTSHALAEYLKLQPNMTEIAVGLRSWSYGLENATVYQNLDAVAAGEIVTVNFRDQIRISKQTYYSLNNEVTQCRDQLISESPTNLLERVNFLLTDAIKLRLRTDVPIGISLSGGLDSAVIACIANQDIADLTAFSYGSLTQHDTEAYQTQLTANHLNTKLNFSYPTTTQMPLAFWETLKLQDAPFPNFSIVAQYCVFKKAHESGIKVMLGGQGSDEIFMGYRKYLFFYLKQLLQQRQHKKSLLFLLQLMPTLYSEFSRLPHYCKNIKRYLPLQKNLRWHEYDSGVSLMPSQGEALWQRQQHDIEKFSIPSLLRYEDRNSMGNSIESRLPFLDHRLVELALALPDTLKINKGYSKWALRELSKERIPQPIAWSRIKKGFEVHPQSWVESGLGDSLRNTLKDHPDLLRTMNLANLVDKVFSNDNLVRQPAMLAECISLVWLASKPFFSW